MSTRQPIDEIVNDALDLPRGERAAFVRGACGGDDAAQDEIMSLLAAYDSAGDFLEAPPVVDAGDDDQLTGRDIGAYRLIERIGTGGMGDVYLAGRRDAHYEQQVAVKVVRGAVFGPDAVRRFRNECRVLAMLEHPNIARMLEGGFTDDGIPYIVMEYINGVPIDRYCADNNLPVERRLSLVRDLCVAVQHIHQHSTIHRDIKCANVLVTPDGVVKLVDFGIAQALDAADEAHPLTATGMEVMTPQYASPEQLRGDVLTTASDVYSLGVVLFKVLTGRLPFSGRNRREMERIVEETAPTRPSTAVSESATDATAALSRSLSRRLRGDVDTIVLMALRKEPERRYSSAEQLGEDLRRHLTGLPVIARGDTFRYRAGKFVLRNSWAVAGLTLFLVTLIAAVVTGFSLYGSAERARQVAVRERQTAERVNSFLQDLLAAANPSGADARLDITVREVLDEAGRQLHTGLEDEPSVAAALHTTIGAAYLNLGAFDQAHEQLDQAMELQQALDRPDPAGEARTRLEYAKLHEKQADYSTAEEKLREAIALLRNDHSADPALLAECEVNLALVLVESSQLEEAEAQALQARETAARIAEPRSPIPVSAAGTLGRVLFRLGRYDEAEARFAEAVAMARERLSDNHALTGECLQNHAVVLGALGRTSEAITEYEQALAVYEIAYPPDHPELGTTRLNLADAYLIEGRYKDALADYESSGKTLAATYGEGHAYVGLALNGQAMCRWRLEGPEAARPLFERAIANLSNGLGENHPWVATPKNNLARVMFELGDPTGAESLAREALASMRAAYPQGHASLARPLQLIADIELAGGHPEVALTAVDEAATFCASLPAVNRDRIGLTLTRADCLVALDRVTEARETLVDARTALDSTVAPDDLRLKRIDEKLEGLPAVADPE
jgi:serine/threonine-protein kinase